MTGVAKEKIAFAVALLAVLFTVTPLLQEIGAIGFSLFELELTLRLLYYVLSALLALAVYCYGIQFAFEWHRKILTLAGDAFYAAAISVPLLFTLLFAGTAVAGLIGRALQSEIARTAASALLGVLSAALASRFAYVTRRHLAAAQREAEFRLYTEQGIVKLRRAERLFSAGHYDLAVIEAFRAVESAARRSVPIHGAGLPARWFDAVSKRLPTPELREALERFRQVRNMAAHAVEPISAGQARKSLATASRLLAALSDDDS